MATHHLEHKLKARPEGFDILFLRWTAPHIRIACGNLGAGSPITLRSAADESVGIQAKVLSYDGLYLSAEIISFERWEEETHNGMARGDVIWCDDSYVITCQSD